MNYLSVENLAKYYGEQLLFEHVTFGIDKGQKIALIAKNGTGKSTLLNIITGRDMADEGAYTLRNDIRVAYLSQTTDIDSSKIVLDAVFSEESLQVQSIRAYESALNDVKLADNEENREKLQQAIDLMNTYKAWDFDARAKEVLHRFSIEDFFKKVGELSGGQQKKVALAKVLLSDADFLIMDEPTNHLDIEMIEWLENFLTTANTTLLMVTHDRFFLDKVCTEILELTSNGIVRYRGKYNYYLEKKQEAIANQLAEVEKNKNIYRRELEWMRSTPQARSTKSKSRIDNFERLKQKITVDLPQTDQAFAVKSERIGNKILEINNLDFNYEKGKPIIKDFSYIFKRGERCGVVGKNGSGKTTLIRLIANELKPTQGKITLGQTIHIGYYSQDEKDSQNNGKRIIDIVKEHAEMVRMSNGNLISASAFLNHFGFGYELQYTFYESLSGGQRRKLHLLMVLITNPNFLLLDEPTNDFDIDTLNILEDFLLHFEGCMLIVSHDRWFMDKLVDHIFIMEENGNIKDYYGNYTDYKISRQKENQQIKRQQKLEKAVESKPIKLPNPNKRTYKEEQEFNQLEKEIEQLEVLKKDLLEQLNNPALLPQKSMEISQQYADTDALLEEKTMRWLELSEKEAK